MASELDIGDCIVTVDGNEAIVDVSFIKDIGARSVATKSSFIVVNGIVASPFARVKASSKFNVEQLVTTLLG